MAYSPWHCFWANRFARGGERADDLCLLREVAEHDHRRVRAVAVKFAVTVCA